MRIRIELFHLSDPDPASYESYENLRTLVYRPSIAPFWASTPPSWASTPCRAPFWASKAHEFWLKCGSGSATLRIGQVWHCRIDHGNFILIVLLFLELVTFCYMGGGAYILQLNYNWTTHVVKKTFVSLCHQTNVDMLNHMAEQLRRSTPPYFFYLAYPPPPPPPNTQLSLVTTCTSKEYAVCISLWQRVKNCNIKWFCI